MSANHRRYTSPRPGCQWSRILLLLWRILVVVRFILGLIDLIDLMI